MKSIKKKKKSWNLSTCIQVSFQIKAEKKKFWKSFKGLKWWWWGCGDLCMNPSETWRLGVIPSSGLSLAESATVVDWSVAKGAFTFWRPLAPIRSPWSPVTQAYSPTEWALGDQVMVKRSIQALGRFKAFLLENNIFTTSVLVNITHLKHAVFPVFLTRKQFLLTRCSCHASFSFISLHSFLWRIYIYIYLQYRYNILIVNFFFCS